MICCSMGGESRNERELDSAGTEKIRTRLQRGKSNLAGRRGKTHSAQRGPQNGRKRGKEINPEPSGEKPGGTRATKERHDACAEGSRPKKVVSEPRHKTAGANKKICSKATRRTQAGALTPTVTRLENQHSDDPALSLR